jgi:hypothetical protein
MGSGSVVGAAAPRPDRRRACVSDILDSQDARDLSTHSRKQGVPFRHLVAFAALATAVYLAIEAAAWAVLYLWLGALAAWAPAMLYSLEAITSLGHAQVYLDDRWQLLGAIEAVNGLILFGLTTAFLFAAIQR